MGQEAKAKSKGRLPEILCATCGRAFSPYVAIQVCCSRRCRGRQQKVKDSLREYGQLPEVKARKNAARRVVNNPGVRERRRRENLRHRGSDWTPEEYDTQVEAQDNRCAVCGERPDLDGVKAASRLHADHDHLTGRKRELLCVRCNPGIGYFLDDPVLLRAAADYIERHRAVAA
jgi:hypothetical protein